jgi:FkbM family methyltransferase
MHPALAWDRPLGRLARLPLRLLPAGLPMPVLSGRNRGMRWVVGAGNSSCWIGTYERAQLDYVCRAVGPGSTVFDVGAHAGYYTLALSRRVGSRGRVVAFEPDAGNAARLRRHLALNAVRNVEVVEAAVLEKRGETRFASAGYLGHVSDRGAAVPTVPLDDYGFADAIKMDVEGAEAVALKGATRILARGRTDVFLSLHGICDAEAVAILAAHRYRIHWLGPRDLHAIPPS